jgi:hypothetical protein
MKAEKNIKTTEMKTEIGDVNIDSINLPGNIEFIELKLQHGKKSRVKMTTLTNVLS